MTRLALGFVALLGLLALAPLARAEDAPEFSARHILVSYQGAERATATRTKAEAKAAAEKALAEAQAPGADFAELSHRYSDDKASDAQGGFLNVFTRGQMTPLFQDAVEAM